MRQEEKIYCSKESNHGNNRGYILYKVVHKKGKGHEYIYSHIQKNHHIISKQVVTVVDLGYHGIEKDYPAV